MKKISIPILSFIVGVLCVVFGINLEYNTFGLIVFKITPVIIGILGAIYTFIYLIDNYPKSWILIILNLSLIFIPTIFQMVMISLID